MQLTAPAPPITDLSERRLLADARAGDPEAFLALVRPHDRALRRLAHRLLGDAGAMDDALQTVYVRAYRALGSFRGGASVATWLHRVAYNVCLDELRRRSSRPEQPLGDHEPPAERGADPADVVPVRADLAAALAALPVDVRAAVLLVDAEGFSYRDAASVLGVAEGTVASRLHHGRRALRRALRPYRPTEDDDDHAA